MSVEMNNYAVIVEEVLNSWLNEVEGYVSKFNLESFLWEFNGSVLDPGC